MFLRKIKQTKKYYLIARQTWDEMLTYRLNFTMWRLRNVLQLLTTYFLWLAVIPQGTSVFGYSQSLMLTYILGASLLGAFVLSSRSGDVGEQINSGDLSNYLVRPINFFLAWFARDIGDKAMNIVFALTELILLFFLLHPPLFLQTNALLLLLAVVAVVFGILIHFFFNLLIGAIGFWSPEVWGPRFIFYIITSFFAGSLFPLDILPKPLYMVMQLLPFPYLLYFPLKVYLGQLPIQEIYHGLIISLLWVFGMYFITRTIWHSGLRSYSAQGR